jgi:asparagine synthase (glutamine-hydrolysing)
MCGIAGLASLGAAAPAPWLPRMVEALAHRGPDATGVYADAGIGLGHARLSVIDLEGGGQPIANEDGSVRVVLNGEIFNYLELRERLERGGHRFATRSDTEVLVHLYEDHGADMVHELNGQFAFALWDAPRRRLLLARDRLGIRPLFYTRAAGHLLFASEVKALFACPAVPRALAPRALGEIFTYWSTLGSGTVFAGIETLPPGCYLTLDEAGARTVRYWDWTFPAATAPVITDAAEAAAELRALLVDAVRLQLRADVPVGAYLSGGLDSSAIVALIKHYTATPLRTFSLRFDEDEFDEGPYQQAMVAALGTHHTTLRCSRRAIGEAFPQTIWHAETPILRTAPTPLLLLSGAVRASGYKVVLTGEGADEVFAGYDLFKEAKIRRFWARRPDSAWRPRLLDRLYPYLRHSPAAHAAFARRFYGRRLDTPAAPGFAHGPRWTTTQRTWQFFSADLRDTVRGWDPDTAIREILPAGFDGWRPLNRDQYVEAHTLLAGYLLSSQGDRMAMANAVEARVPFLDHRVVEFGSRLAPELKLRGLDEKHVLKRAVGDLLPEVIRRRPKQPYRAPDSASFFAAGAPLEYAAELLSERRLREAGYFDPAAVRRLVEKCRKGEAIGFADNMAFVGILSTMLVDQMFLRGTDTTRRPALSLAAERAPALLEPVTVGA